MKCKTGFKKVGKKCLRVSNGMRAVCNSTPLHYGYSIGFFELLGILFIGLKLGNVISWSWWLALMPIYFPVVLGLIIILIVLLAGGFRR